LNAVIGMTGLLLGTPLDAEQRDFVETVHASGDALLEIVNDILDFSKIEAGRLELEILAFDVRTAVEEALDLVANRASDKDLDLVYQLGDEVPHTLLGDVSRVRQVLLNLLTNAVKFTDGGEVEVLVSAEPTGNDTRLIHFAVRDTGIGIPADRMDRLFQSFSQVDASTTRRYGGTGLGLVISKRLAEAMGGALWVESEVGVGSIFHFTLEASVAEGFESQRHGHTPGLEGKRLLVVDDNATNRRILTSQCTGWGLEVHAAESPRKALEWLAVGAPFDLAILDMQMPEMDGLALAREIRRFRSLENLPLLMLSSLGRRPKGDDAALFVAHLAKPVRVAALHAALLGALGVPADRSPSTPAPGASRSGAAVVWRAPEGLRVLLVEDNRVNQKVALRLLERIGIRADLAGNGLEALQALDRQLYDLILMDVHMPEMDGFEATRSIRRHAVEPRPWIVAMTGGVLDGDRELCFAAGMDDFVSKPVLMDELVEAFCRHQRSRDAAADTPVASLDHCEYS